MKELYDKIGSALEQMLKKISNSGSTTLLSLHGTWLHCLEFFPVVGHHIFISCKLSCLTQFFSSFTSPLSQKYSTFSVLNFKEHFFHMLIHNIHIYYYKNGVLYCKKDHLVLKQSAVHKLQDKTLNAIKIQTENSNPVSWFLI